MSKIKKQFRQDFNSSHKVDLSFDNSKLEDNTRFTKHATRKKLLIAILVPSISIAFIGAPIALILSIALKTTESVKAIKREFTMNEIRIAESNTFKKLNSVTYPNQTFPLKNELGGEARVAYNNFVNTTYHSLVTTSKKDNMSYSSIGLYSILNELYSAASRDDLKIDLDNLLGLNETQRETFYTRTMYANSFAADQTTTQLKNAAFFNNRFNYSRSYVNKLDYLYCDAYQLSFESDINKVIEWVNQAVNSNGYIDPDFLGIDDETQLLLMSTMYFKNAWENKYLSKDNIEDDFYLANGSTTKATYMAHSYFTDVYYDYDSYISLKDYYYNGNASITYIVPKNVNDEIFELTKDVNIFSENEENMVGEKDKSFIGVKLKTPKLSLTTDIDFKNCLTSLGFGDIYNPGVDSFKNAFSDESLTDEWKIYIQTVKQRNEVTFNEDGTTVKSLSFVSMGARGAARSVGSDALEVDLNQPFIYIIRDVNDTPIFVGHVDNPNA